LHINNYPRSYSLNDSHKLIEEISLFRSSNNNICLWVPILFVLSCLLIRRSTPFAEKFAQKTEGLAFLSWARSSTSMQRVIPDRQRYPGSSKMASLYWILLEYSDVNEPVPMTFLFFYDWTGFFFQNSHSQNVGQIWTEQWQAGVAKLSLWGTPYLLEIENKSEVVFFFWEPVYK